MRKTTPVPCLKRSLCSRAVLYINCWLSTSWSKDFLDEGLVVKRCSNICLNKQGALFVWCRYSLLNGALYLKRMSNIFIWKNST